MFINRTYHGRLFFVIFPTTLIIIITNIFMEYFSLLGNIIYVHITFQLWQKNRKLTSQNKTPCSQNDSICNKHIFPCCERQAKITTVKLEFSSFHSVTNQIPILIEQNISSCLRPSGLRSIYLRLYTRVILVLPFERSTSQDPLSLHPMTSLSSSIRMSLAAFI